MKSSGVNEYKVYFNLLKKRVSVRTFKPDSVPDEYIVKVLEAGRWAMSAANSQPWEFIVVKDTETKRRIAEAYREEYTTYSYWMEQQRVKELRHPSYRAEGETDPHKELEKVMARAGSFGQAPVLIVVLGDGRRQWGTTMGAHTFGRGMTHLTDGLANCCMLMQLAAASLGLGSQWVTIVHQEPFKRILGVPDLLMVYLIMPLGYPANEWKPSYRRELSELVHYEKYDMNKYMTDEQFMEYLRKLREITIPKYGTSYSQPS